MLDTQKMLSRLSVPGLFLLAAGALLGFFSRQAAALLFRDKAERWVMPLKGAGLALTLLGALILLDVIPGL